MKKIILSIFLLLATLGFSQSTFIPEKNSKNRKDIMDIFREDFSKSDKIIFRVEHFLISQNWACAEVTPLKDNVEYSEPRWGLFNLIGGKWKLIEWSKFIEVENDFELIDLPKQNSNIAKLIVKKYKCSITIFKK